MDNININGLIVEQFYDSNNNRVIKLENKNKQKISGKILLYMPSVPKPITEWIFKLNPNTWFVPSLKTFGLSYFKLIIDGGNEYFFMMKKEKNLIKIEDKVICVGLNKTGTSSILSEMINIGYEVFPKNHNESNYTEKFFNNNIGTAIDIMEKGNYNFFKDIPWSCPGISEKIIKYTPNSKFILSVRENPEKWVNSVKNFWKKYLTENGDIINNNTKIKFLDEKINIEYFGYLQGMFDSWNLDLYDGKLEDKLYHVYINHYNSVKSTLIKYNCDWIEIDVSKKGELKKLTNWLGIKHDKEDFIQVNKGKYGN